MNRRCSFLDSLPAFNFNMGGGEHQYDSVGRWTTDTKQLGSTLMTTMIREVVDFCDPGIKENWSLKPHQQVTGKTNYNNEYRNSVETINPRLSLIPF